MYWGEIMFLKSQGVTNNHVQCIIKHDKNKSEMVSKENLFLDKLTSQ